MELRNARVLITGGAGGIGSEIARALLGQGAAVLLADLDAAALDRVVAGPLAAHADRIGTVAGNLTEPDGRARVIAAAAAFRGGINVLVNNAGVNHFALFDDQSPGDIDLALAVNVAAPLHLCRLALPLLKRQPEAAILNMGSVFGEIGYPGYALYSATKFATRGFSEALRRELAGTSVRVLYLAPRATRTPINPERVTRMNAELGVAMDEPSVVAAAACRVLAEGTAEAVVGWPERLYARLNRALPRLVDGSIVKQLPVIQRYAVRQPRPATPPATPVLPTGSERTAT
jgi:short-subunit dehydrogenase